eukprot:Tamp_26830.p1 GENE.Tamp_26830~~Tamp_26830.p1  ORF type:complete len:185 (+),score=33.30 Tamp_26830:85-639(+)
MAKPLVSQVFGKIKNYRMQLGEHESRGGHEISLTSNGQPLRVCLYEEYVAATHHLRKDMGRITDFWSYFGASGAEDKKEQKLVGGTVVRVLPGNFSCEVEWDNGQKGVYFQSVLYYGEDVPPRDEDAYRKLISSRAILAKRPDLKKKHQEEMAKRNKVTSVYHDPKAAADKAASRNRWARWRPS